MFKILTQSSCPYGFIPITDATALQLQTTATRIQDLIDHLFEAKAGTWESLQYQALLQEREVIQSHCGPSLKTTGIHLFPNGATFLGTLVNYQPTGAGIIEASDKTTYEGFFTLDPPLVPKTEIGILHTPQDPVIHSLRGSFYNGAFSGYGEINLKNKNRYQGTLVDSHLCGKGSFFYFEQNDVLLVDFINDSPTGRGVYILQDGSRYEATFVKGHPNHKTYIPSSGNQLRSESPELGDIIFVQLLLGIQNVFTKPNIVLHYALHFLKKHPNQMIYDLIKDAVDITNEILDNPQAIDEIAGKIHEDLMKDLPRLFHFNARDHAMGLLISPNCDETGNVSSFIINIYNSGERIEKYHFFNKDINKYATELQIEIPARSLTASLISNILKTFSSVDQAYETIFAIPGSRILNKPTTWQTDQKGDNCTLEWIFAFLKNQMTSSKYDQLRLDLFKACIESGDALHTEGNAKQEWDTLRPILLQKIKKRLARLGWPL